jgi:hypothetical protein
MALTIAIHSYEDVSIQKTSKSSTRQYQNIALIQNSSSFANKNKNDEKTSKHMKHKDVSSKIRTY